ncbi:sulfite exporter TauE/SafE family protein [Nitrospirillum sp. BR 11752]|uniref:sulfite exporter TauE/SafE family protein n=1 Tax=Nitrospirillum sp. BR 11752 TaxID=3104293 RepID=UPI002E9D2F7B|nr:sulfite exporter TauE/SafE family protein [Nitrospirillum sp. BR 11752]
MHDHLSMLQSAPLSLPALMAAVFMAGLTGGFGHCVGMCGPFVLAQVGAGEAARPALARPAGVLLLPYHLGRMTTYAALGAVAGGLSGLVVRATEYRWLLAVFLGIAALLFLRQGLAGLGRVAPRLVRLVPAGRFSLGTAGAARLTAALARPLRRLFADPRGLNGYLLGVLLGFIPCGMVYAALAAAVSSGSAGGGALVLAAFAVGTAPSLMTVAVAGRAVGRQFSGVAAWVTPPLMLLNAALLLSLAFGVLDRSPF